MTPRLVGSGVALLCFLGATVVLAIGQAAFGGLS